jgi:hypothetical protein
LVVKSIPRSVAFVCGGLLFAAGCAAKVRAPAGVDCTEDDGFELLNISDFKAGDSGWFLYADATPGGIPDPKLASNVESIHPDPPEGCGKDGDTGMIELRASGHNFYGTGFGDWIHNAGGSRANGTGYEGISFWARSPGNTDKTFTLSVDDGQTIVLPPEVPDGGGPLPVATAADQDLDGDGFVGPGDIARGTRCRLPPPQDLGRAACYYGGTQPPATATRVPEPDECGNQFHTNITTTPDWHFYLVPWNQLVQWPCPNRLAGGIDGSDIAKMEIKFIQGSSYDLWLDNIAFYRRRADAGSGN